MTPARLEVARSKLVLIGLVAGLFAGGFGVGGGFILVPLLVAVGVDRHRSHATSLAAIIPIAVAGALTFGSSGEVDLQVGLWLGLGGVAGSMVGASLMHRMSARRLALVFGAVLLAVALRMITGADPVAGSSEYGAVLAAVLAVLIGLIAGVFAGVAGVGGGAVLVPASVLLLGLGQHAAQGTSLVAIILTSIGGTVVNRRNRRVSLREGLLVGVSGAAGAVAGSRLALGVEARTLSLLFGLLVLVVAVRTLYRGWRGEAEPES